MHRKHPLNLDLSPFTPELLIFHLKKSGNSTATGPDGMTIRHLKHLGPLGLNYLCTLFNLSLSHANLPAIWKRANIIVLPKPGKPKDSGTSYRPISLLCPASKLLERLMQERIKAHLHLAESQHVFRTGRSTTTALLPLTHQIIKGFNEKSPPSRTIAMALDFSKAFDTVNHTSLLKQLLNTTLDNNSIRWLSTYLRGRTAAVTYLDTTSKQRIIKTGVPQGSVLSPLLFNFYMSDFPPTSLQHASYADDFTSWASSTDVATAAEILTGHDADVAGWASGKDLQISTQKSTATLFTSENRQSQLNPDITLNSHPLPLDRRPKILGVTFDTHLTFSPHINSIADRAASRLRILKSLAGSSWGQQKETLVFTYKCLLRPLHTYAAPVWFPNVSDSAVRKLQSTQNSALRIATGSLKMSPIPHLHSETKILPVREHLSLLCKQFLVNALRPHHPSRRVVTDNTNRRPRRTPIRYTLQSKYLPSIQYVLTDGLDTVDQYREAITTLHTDCVRSTLASFPDNPVL